MRQFFTEANDRLSMTRLCTFILVNGGLALCFVYPEHAELGLGVIMLGLSGKVGQKFIENKNRKDEIHITNSTDINI